MYNLFSIDGLRPLPIPQDQFGDEEMAIKADAIGVAALEEYEKKKFYFVNHKYIVIKNILN